MVTLAGFETFVRDVMLIKTTQLPPDAPITAYCLNLAKNIVNPALHCMGLCPTMGEETIYDIATYNLAADYLINFAPDQPGQDYFLKTRKDFHINSFVAGVISNSADETTSEGILNPDFMKGFTMSDLQRLKTPYGRQYLQLAQEYGPPWGLS